MRELALIRDAVARARLADDPVYQIKQRRRSGRERPHQAPNPRLAHARPLNTDELDVLRLVAEGMTNSEIAAQRFVSVHTVASRLKRVFSHLGANDRAHAVAIAFRRGLID